MKRILTVVAASALVVGVSLPAAALSKPADAATAQTVSGPALAAEQGVSVVVAAPELASRDGYAAEAKPEPVTTYASSFSGPVPDVFLGMFPVWPASGSLNDGFGYRDGGEFHGGIDIIAPEGTPIVAAGAGTVTQVSSGGGWGNYVRIAHNGSVQTLYAHMTHSVVGAGQFVDAGQLIGYVGATGYATAYHLHFEVWLDGTRVDPMPFFN